MHLISRIALAFVALPEVPLNPTLHVQAACALEDFNATVVELHDGRELEVHDPEQCAGQFCSIHNPSDHELKDAPLNWRRTYLMERICQCGIGHPDPDHLAFLERAGYDELAEEQSIHACCGCCGAFDVR